MLISDSVSNDSWAVRHLPDEARGEPVCISIVVRLRGVILRWGGVSASLNELYRNWEGTNFCSRIEFRKLEAPNHCWGVSISIRAIGWVVALLSEDYLRMRHSWLHRLTWTQGWGVASLLRLAGALTLVTRQSKQKSLNLPKPSDLWKQSSRRASSGHLYLIYRPWYSPISVLFFILA